MKLLDFITDNKIIFLIGNVALIFGFIWLCLHPSPFAAETLISYASILHGGHSINTFLKYKYGHGQDVGTN